MFLTSAVFLDPDSSFVLKCHIPPLKEAVTAFKMCDSADFGLFFACYVILSEDEAD